MPETAPARTVIAQAVDRLQAEGIADPHREALRIWNDLGGNRWAGLGLGNDLVGGTLAERFSRAIERRARGEPTAYAAGTTGFRHLSLRIDRRALIPRPETEGLIDLLLPRVRSGAVADVGTGSGCLALSLAQEGSFTEVIGIDCSADAISLARSNTAELGPEAPVHLIRGDLCAPLSADTLDALVSNPPYLTVEEYGALDSSVRDWEPAVALVGGVDGLAVSERLLEEGLHVVRPGGWIAMEVDCSRAEVAARRASELGWECVSVHVDLFGRERYLLARRSDTR